MSSVKIQQGNAFYQYLAAFLIALMIINDGMFYGWTSPSLEKLQQENSTIKITNDEGSWIATMPLIGSILGSAIISFTIDYIGRKKAILYTAIPFFASWIMIAYANSVEIIYISRFIAGAFDSLLFTGATMYFGEIAEPRIRGFMLSSVPLDWIIGILFINIIGFYLSIKTAALVSAIFPIISLVTFFWMPETPYALLMKNDPEGAERSLQFFRGRVDVDSELNRISEGIKNQITNTGKFLDLFTVKSNRKALFIIAALRGAQQFSGPTAIMFYTQTIFKEAGGTIATEVATFIYVTMQVIMCVISSFVSDKAGRRPLLLVSALGTAIALLIQGIYFYIKSNTAIDTSSFSYVPVVALIGFVIIFSLGMQTIPIILLGELFPANVKAFAFCLADIYFGIIATVVSKFFQFMTDNFGMFVPFLAFATSCFIGLVLIYFMVPETKGKTLEDLQMYLKGETSCENNDKGSKNKV